MKKNKEAKKFGQLMLDPINTKEVCVKFVESGGQVLLILCVREIEKSSNGDVFVLAMIQMMQSFNKEWSMLGVWDPTRRTQKKVVIDFRQYYCGE